MWNASSQEADRELVVRCQQGDPSAFEELVGKYQQQVLNLVCHYIGFINDIEDIAQKIFIKVYFSLPKFDTQRPFFPWLYRIAVNQCYDELRHKRRRRTYTFSELNLEDSRSIEKLVGPSEDATRADEAAAETRALLGKMLDQLPDHQRKVLVLRDIESIPYAEMASILRCTEQAARLKVFRARNRLRAILEKTLPKTNPESGA